MPYPYRPGEGKGRHDETALHRASAPAGACRVQGRCQRGTVPRQFQRGSDLEAPHHAGPHPDRPSRVRHPGPRVPDQGSPPWRASRADATRSGTPIPTRTWTPKPTRTWTPKPTRTWTPKPTATATPGNTSADPVNLGTLTAPPGVMRAGHSRARRLQHRRKRGVV